jgi:N-acetylmuramoyl-L-alanine amidase
LCGCVGVLLALACAPAGAASGVEGLRLSREGAQTRLVFDLVGKPAYKISLAENPARLIIDLEDTRLATTLQGAELGGTPIQRIRSGMYTPRDLRIVLDLVGPVEPQGFLLPPGDGQGHRLVIDVKSTGPLPATPAEPASPTAPARKELSPAASALLADAPTDAGASASTGRSAQSAAPAASPAAQQRAAADEPARIVRAEKGRPILIAVDAGHGGEDPGALGPRRVREKDVVLAIARELARRIDQQPGYKATLVRKGDYFIPLKQRRDIARAAGADLFVSVHADAFTHSRAHGSSVYALSQRGATSTSAAFLAQRENGTDLIGGVALGEKDEVLAGVLTDLSMTATMEASLGVGNRVLGSMGKISKLHSRRVEQAGFAVLKSPDMPSILVETGFISNPAEAERLASRHYQQSLARAIFEGLGNYFLSTPPPDTQVALAARAGARPDEYVIAHGDTLSGIAERYRVSVAALVKTNRLGGEDGIQAGQRILIPKS